MTTPYHHGDLRAALLTAAESLLEREGESGLTLRAAARAAGVSHAAPAHHFGDLAGLLAALAAQGYQQFGDELAAAAAHAREIGLSPLNAIGQAYVRFARAHANLFLLMFRGDRLDHTRPALRAARDAAFAVLRDNLPPGPADPRPTAIAAWSLVHGFAFLAIDHQLPPDQPVEFLLDKVLQTWHPPAV